MLLFNFSKRMHTVQDGIISAEGQQWARMSTSKIWEKGSGAMGGNNRKYCRKSTCL